MSGWVRLPHLSALRISGPDAAAFVHSQFTTELFPAVPSNWQLSAWCNPKGRVLNVIVVRVNEDGVELAAPTSQMESLPRLLQRYAIGRKLRFGDVLPVAGNLGGSAAPREVLAIDPDRALRIGVADAAADPAAASSWRLRDICSGVAWLSDETSGQFLPQALGLEERGGLSFRKGCYPGQEVIARVHYLGRAKERLSGFRALDSSELADRSMVDDGGNKAGTVLCSEAMDGQRIGLAVVSSDLSDEARVLCADRELALLSPSELC